ncbi:glycoprotein-N-acetylgalactosamine 3-beta-galactosyltransferase 1-like [Drosophila kikkawai]|uniref:N-acetylgalactosaminide beta-1,3-galactosyltransferase n=1 Tax=Drosophila kikkawai TaxID=30033 RepID=A0A6P4I558_DROKI|nr:glycoprotein-N-acetylgalactosamine 3-beta-galactosyltransferase 1-like [Drosophila kikkawai]
MVKMSGIYWNFLCLALGLIMGIGLALIFEFFETSNVDLERQNQGDTTPQNPMEDVLANRLHNETRILCMVLTIPENHETKAAAVKRTWGRRCNKLIFISSQEDKELGAINVHILEKRRYVFRKVRKAIKYVYQNFVEDYDWFLRADDDSFVIMENLHLLLYPYNPEFALYFGHRCHSSSWQGKKCEGASYVMSREALRRLHRLPRNIYKLYFPSLLPEEEQLAFCMRQVGAVAGHSRDEEGHDRFLSLALPDKMPKIKDMLSYNNVEGFGSKFGISIHQVKSHDVMEFLLYRLIVFGAPPMSRLLPPKLELEQMEKLMTLWALGNQTDLNPTLRTYLNSDYQTAWKNQTSKKEILKS